MERHVCQCNWPDCQKYFSHYEKHGNNLQKGLFQLTLGNSIKKKEFRSLTCSHLGIKDNGEKRIWIANYHWDSRLLEYLKHNNKYRSTPLDSKTAKEYNIYDRSISYKKEGKFFYPIPNLTNYTIRLEVSSFSTTRSARLSKRTSSEIETTIENA